MAKRKAPARKLPLEWVGKWMLLTAKAVINTDELDLDLLQDEIAEIQQIDSYLVLDGAAAAQVDDASALNAMLSMDPSSNANPTAVASVEDLETFFTHFLNIATIADSTVVSAQRHKDESHKVWRAQEGKPILVGTNVGMVAEWNTSADLFTNAQWQVRLYFTRRRANATDLNQILLKRR